MHNLNIATDKNLLNRLKEATKRELTSDEISKQRVSIIYSGMPESSRFTKSDVEKALKSA